MKKIFKTFTFYFFIASIIIIILNLIGADYKNMLLIGLNPILILISLIEPLRYILSSIETVYIIHLITFVIYGAIIDTFVYGCKYIIKNIKELNK